MASSEARTSRSSIGSEEGSSRSLSRIFSDPGVPLPTGKDGIYNPAIEGGPKTPVVRMRHAQRTTVPAEATLAAIAQDAETRLAAKRKERAERRSIKLAEIKKRQTIEEQRKSSVTDSGDNGDPFTLSASSSVSSGLDKHGRDHVDSVSSFDRNESVPTQVIESRTENNVHPLYSRGESLDAPRRGRNNSEASSNSADVDGDRFVPNAQYKELKQKFSELEEKFKKCMITNEQLDNEKSALGYRLDLIQDQSEEQNEKLAESNRLFKEKSREVEKERRRARDAERNVALLRLQLQQRQDLIEHHGLVLVGGDVIGEEITENPDGSPRGKVGAAALVTPVGAALLEKAAGSTGTLDSRLRKFAAEKDQLRDTIKRLQIELETTKTTPMLNGHGVHDSTQDLDPLDEVKKLEDKKRFEESKLKLAKAELEMTNLEGTVVRMEQQIKRYQELLADSEKSEDDLKTERRKLQRELRDAQVKVEELTTANKHLQTRLEKIRAIKGNVLNELNKPL